MRTRKNHLRKTHNVPNKRLDYILLGVIMVVAAVLRLWKLGQVPFMHDEFSALLRTRFDNFHDFIQHPRLYILFGQNHRYTGLSPSLSSAVP